MTEEEARLDCGVTVDSPAAVRTPRSDVIPTDRRLALAIDLAASAECTDPDDLETLIAQRDDVTEIASAALDECQKLEAELLRLRRLGIDRTVADLVDGCRAIVEASEAATAFTCSEATRVSTLLAFVLDAPTALDWLACHAEGDSDIDNDWHAGRADEYRAWARSKR